MSDRAEHQTGSASAIHLCIQQQRVEKRGPQVSSDRGQGLHTEKLPGARSTSLCLAFPLAFAAGFPPPAN